MKPGEAALGEVEDLVAPRAGAWIETSATAESRSTSNVAPRAGAWIETPQKKKRKAFAAVAPRAGAWIETPRAGCRNSKSKGRPPRGGVD